MRIEAEIAEAFQNIEPSALLKNSILDAKSEKLLVQALVTSLNRDERIARAEVGRVDLAVFRSAANVQNLSSDDARFLAEAKFAFLWKLSHNRPSEREREAVSGWLVEDLVPGRHPKRKPHYNGYDLRLDLERLRRKLPRRSGPARQSPPILGLFFIGDVEPPEVCAKDQPGKNAKKPTLPRAQALVTAWVGADPRVTASLDLGELFGAAIKVHLLVFSCEDLPPLVETPPASASR